MKVYVNKHATVSFVYWANTNMTYLLHTTETPQTDGMVDLPEVNNTTKKTYKNKDTQDVSEIHKHLLFS